jgi:hypothetical protein
MLSDGWRISACVDWNMEDDSLSTLPLDSAVKAFSFALPKY